jgi:hypothetical protein
MLHSTAHSSIECASVSSLDAAEATPRRPRERDAPLTSAAASSSSAPSDAAPVCANCSDPNCGHPVSTEVAPPIAFVSPFPHAQLQATRIVLDQIHPHLGTRMHAPARWQ